MLEAKIRFFDIKKCGFFLRGKDSPEFGSINDTLEKLNSWANDGREFVNTSCYEADPDNDIQNTYFCGWHENKTSKDSLLILWNEAPNDNGTIYGMNPMERPGNTSMLTTGFGNIPAIPGSPSYFWFIPNKNIFATIRFNHSVQGKSNLDNYLNGYLSNKSPYRVMDDSNENIIGYSKNGIKNEKSDRTSSKFYAIGRKQEELEAELLTNLGKIRKIIKRETLQYTSADDRGLLERVFSNLLQNTPVFTSPRTITQELQFQPTELELREIISQFSELNIPNSIQNAGFIYNDGKRIMLKGSSFTFSAELNVNLVENQIISPQILLSALIAQKIDLLRPLDEPSFEIEDTAGS